MKIEELNNIVSTMDIEKIKEALEKRGYRNASIDGTWEFDPIAIAKAKNVENSERYEDIWADKVFVGDIHTQVTEYPNVKFIVITVKNVYRNKNNLEVPFEMILYTDAPIDIAYEQEQNKLFACELCKKQFPKRELCEVNGKLICDDCFEEDLKRLMQTNKSKLRKKVRFWK